MFTSWSSSARTNCTNPWPRARTNGNGSPERRDRYSVVHQTHSRTPCTPCNSRRDRSGPHSHVPVPLHPPRPLPGDNLENDGNCPLDPRVARVVLSDPASPTPCSRSGPRTNAPQCLPNRRACLSEGETRTPIPQQRHDG